MSMLYPERHPSLYCCYVLGHHEGEGDGTGRSKQSRSEKKSRKAMLKLGMKPIPGVSRVTVKKSKNVSCPLFILLIIYLDLNSSPNMILGPYFAICSFGYHNGIYYVFNRDNLPAFAAKVDFSH